MYPMCVCYCTSVSAGVSAGALSVTHIHTSYMCCLHVYIYAHVSLQARARELEQELASSAAGTSAVRDHPLVMEEEARQQALKGIFSEQERERKWQHKRQVHEEFYKTVGPELEHYMEQPDAPDHQDEATEPAAEARLQTHGTHHMAAPSIGVETRDEMPEHVDDLVDEKPPPVSQHASSLPRAAPPAKAWDSDDESDDDLFLRTRGGGGVVDVM